jgi:hypothetical protein
MGDKSITDTDEQFEKRWNKRIQLLEKDCNESYARNQFIGKKYVELTKNSISWILNHIDCFVSQCRGNKIVEHVDLCPYAVDGHGGDAWDKVGQAIGNLQALKEIYISTHNYHDDHDEDDDELVPPAPIPDWEILSRILSHVRQKVTIFIDDGAAVCSSVLWASYHY